MEISGEVETILKEARKPEMVSLNGYRPFAFRPDHGGGMSVETFEGLRESPARITQSAVALTAADFLAYWARYSNHSSVVFADERAATYLAIFDYHGADGTPRWAAHRAKFQAVLTPEWTVWKVCSGKRMVQRDFAEFIEENYIDVVTPSHAEMMEVATNLQAVKTVNFSQAIRLQNGTQQLRYEEEVRGTTTSGSVIVPDRFVIEVPVFAGGQKYPVTALLRYNISEGKLQMWYDLHRPHKAIEAATQELTGIIRAGVTPGAFFLGAPA